VNPETPVNAKALLPDATRLGPVNLTVRDSAAMAGFYGRALGLNVQRPAHSDGAGDVTGDGNGAKIVGLGCGGEDLVRLIEDPLAVEAGRHASLYHFCLAVERRADLGWWLRRLIDGGFELQGLVDHRMAEAIYLEDPEGNGVELNWDRPRSEWRPWAEWLAMGNAPLDSEGLLLENEKAGPRESQPASTRVGHLHLHVGDLAASQAFYCAALGLAKTAEVPGQAVFTSAGGYHHHIAFNVWKGRNVPPQPEGAYGLRSATLVLPASQDVQAAAARLQAAGYSVETAAGGVFTRDPSHHGLLLRAAN
jgi:catechol 2,3-dioxygenase